MDFLGVHLGLTEVILVVAFSLGVAVVAWYYNLGIGERKRRDRDSEK
jgi:hypothetical protein